MRHGGRFIAILVVGTLAVACAAVLSLAVGSRSIPFGDVVGVLMGSGDGGFTTRIVQTRIPRTVFGILAGAALGVSGLLMQSVTRNPIADPSILGVNSGASLAVVCGIAFLGVSTAGEYMALAIAGATLTALLVYGVGSMGSNGATPLKLALAGTAVSTALTSLVSIVVMPRQNVMNTFRFWQIGSVGAADWSDVSLFAPVVVVAFVVALLLAPSLEILAMGDATAVGLGAKPGLVRGLGSAAGVVLCGATTAIAGPIGFVGLMVPHAVRLVFRNGDLRQVAVLSAVVGALLLTVSDVIGRVAISPGELEVGIVTAVVGAPVFIYVAVTAGKKSGFEEVA